jgi:hypothetical protein
MSTRSQIVVLNDERDATPKKPFYPHYFYKHSDGYPEGVLPTLLPLVREFSTNRGEDSCYFVAQLSAAFARDAMRQDLAQVKYHQDLIAKGEDVERNKQMIEDYYTVPRMTGYGIDADLHSDIEYLYIVSTKPNDAWVKVLSQPYVEGTPYKGVDFQSPVELLLDVKPKSLTKWEKDNAEYDTVQDGRLSL